MSQINGLSKEELLEFREELGKPFQNGIRQLNRTRIGNHFEPPKGTKLLIGRASEVLGLWSLYWPDDSLTFEEISFLVNALPKHERTLRRYIARVTNRKKVDRPKRKRGRPALGSPPLSELGRPPEHYESDFGNIVREKSDEKAKVQLYLATSGIGDDSAKSFEKMLKRAIKKTEFKEFGLWYISEISGMHSRMVFLKALREGESKKEANALANELANNLFETLKLNFEKTISSLSES